MIVVIIFVLISIFEKCSIRTLHFGTPTEHMKTCYTAVLKGHIALASLIIPEGMLGSRIDCVARTALWKLGLDYNHGTGHGVGSYLNVHEGPQGIGYRKRENEVVSWLQFVNARSKYLMGIMR